MILFISPHDIFYTILMLITGRIDLPNIMFFPITMYGLLGLNLVTLLEIHDSPSENPTFSGHYRAQSF